MGNADSSHARAKRRQREAERPTAFELAQLAIGLAGLPKQTKRPTNPEDFLLEAAHLFAQASAVARNYALVKDLSSPEMKLLFEWTEQHHLGAKADNQEIENDTLAPFLPGRVRNSGPTMTAETLFRKLKDAMGGKNVPAATWKKYRHLVKSEGISLSQLYRAGVIEPIPEKFEALKDQCPEYFEAAISLEMDYPESA